MPRRPVSYSKARAAEDLRAHAAAGKVLRFNDLPAPLRRAVHQYWGGMANARRLLRLPALVPGRRSWTTERVIAEIRRLHRKGQHMSQNAVAKAGRMDLLLAAARLFGSWTRAREHAGVQLAKRRSHPKSAWDDTTIVSEIQARHGRGEPLAVTKTPSSLVSAAQRIFGSWREAIEAAGFQYDEIVLARRYDDDDLLEWLRALARTRPDMTLYDLDRHGQHTVACRRRWGSLEAAAEAAGLSGWPVRVRHEAMSRDEVVKTLRRLVRARVPINLTHVRGHPGFSRLVNSAFKHFATWDDAVATAGLPPHRKQRAAWTREEALDQLRRWHREGKSVRAASIAKHDVSLYNAARRLFGSHAAAIKAAGILATASS
jgi:hypothetical protein